MTRRGHFPFFLIILLITQPLFAQTQDDKLSQLEQKLDELLRQATEIRQEIDKLKGAQPEDLTKVETVEAPQPSAPPPATPAAPQLTDVQTIDNQIAPGASKVFNPDTSVIGNFVGRTGQTNPFEERAPLSLEEAEVAFEAFVDPYMKAKFFIAVGPEGAEVEEGYANLLTLPYDLTAKVGKMKMAFGKDNTWHTHVRPWVDQPLVIHNFFGDEGLNDSGISISKSFQNNVAFVEGTGEVFNGGGDGNDLFYNGHLKAFKDITENSNVEVGTSYARGADNRFGGVDVTYRWKPLQQSLYHSFIGRFEGIVRDGSRIDNTRTGLDRTLKGFYASADYQLGRRWYTGVRLDRADRDDVTDRGASATLTFWPSEFSQFRAQLRRISYGGAKSITELLFGMQFSIGAHGAHTF